MSSPYRLASTTSEVRMNVPASALDLPSWLFGMSDAEYQHCSKGHWGAGASTLPDGRRTSVNVESVGGHLGVSHYVEEFSEPDHLKLVSLRRTPRSRGDEAVRREPRGTERVTRPADGRSGAAIVPAVVLRRAEPHRLHHGASHRESDGGRPGVFWLATGLWPLAHYRSFEAVTGPKDVKTMGALIAVVGGALLVSARRRDPTPEAAVLGAAAAAALTAADLRFVARGRISRVYLLDVVAEAPFLAGWAAFAIGRLSSAR